MTVARRPSRNDPTVAGLLDRCTFPAHDAPNDGPVHVAVSGGADSTALLALAVATGGGVTAHHVDHGLRPDGQAEADRVSELCSGWGAAFEAHRVEVGDGANLEARCREARRAAMPAGVLFGHTADDQAETVILRLIRGTGPWGLSAMDPLAHPLLELRRSDTEALCRHLGVQAFEDPTNSDARFTRNRVRAEVLPLLCDVAERDVVPLLARLADQARSQSEALAAAASGMDPTDAAALASAPEPVAVDALRRWWCRETSTLPPDAAATHRMLDVARLVATSCDVTGGWRLHRTGGRLRLVARADDVVIPQ